MSTVTDFILTLQFYTIITFEQLHRVL